MTYRNFPVYAHGYVYNPYHSGKLGVNYVFGQKNAYLQTFDYLIDSAKVAKVFITNCVFWQSLNYFLSCYFRFQSDVKSLLKQTIEMQKPTSNKLENQENLRYIQPFKFCKSIKKLSRPNLELCACEFKPLSLNYTDHVTNKQQCPRTVHTGLSMARLTMTSETHYSYKLV